MKRFLSVIIVAVIMVSVLPVSHVSAYVTGTVGQYNTISAGGDHSMVIKTDGTLWAWGSVGYGQLGTDMRFDYRPFMGFAWQIVPDKVMDDVISVSAGDGFTMAIKNDHTLWAWGSNTLYDLGNDGESNVNNMDKYGREYSYQTIPIKIMDDVEAVSAGYNHTMAIKTDGTLWAWGHNDYGQFGNNEIGNFSDEGHRIQTTPVKIMDDVASVSTAYRVTMIIKTDGTLWACGNNQYGQIGNGGSGIQTTPVKIMDNVVSVSTSGYHTMAIKNDGSLWAWGKNEYHELGNGKGGTISKKHEYYEDIYVQEPIYERKPVKIMDNVAAVSAGYGFTMAIKTDGTLWAWGLNDRGQLGNGGKGDIKNDNTVVQTKPVKIMDNVASVSASQHHVLAVTMDGTLRSWGLNDSGQLGYNGVTDISKWGDYYQTVPKKVMSGVDADRAIAKPSTSAVLVDGRKISFDAYTINGSNYFKLRDLAAVLSGSEKQFDVTWDNANKAINLISGKPYTTVGGELTAGDGKSKIVARSKSKIYTDGVPVALRAYTINGNNYFKLRDVAKVFNFSVEWDGKTNTIVLDTSENYVD
ncbi:stalk domain-containing protein [Pseudoclostridium thermosuccinogenes]|nr:stalk domain-containing protein [Pseudoclostridium thermosuccinogenes]